jgi:hypothetical protein
MEAWSSSDSNPPGGATTHHLVYNSSVFLHIAMFIVQNDFFFFPLDKLDLELSKDKDAEVWY